MMRGDNPNDRIPEDRVATILTRAAELDRSAPDTVGLDVIRAAAMEAGISAVAVDRALTEYVAGEAPQTHASDRERQPRTGRGWVARLLRPVKHGAVALVAGALAGSVGEGAGPLVAAGTAAFLYASWRLIRLYRPSRRMLGFQAAVAAMTLGAAGGFAAANSHYTVAEPLLMVGGVVILVGSIAIRVGPRRGQTSAAHLGQGAVGDLVTGAARRPSRVAPGSAHGA